jgi:hypothetical protein
LTACQVKESTAHAETTGNGAPDDDNPHDPASATGSKPTRSSKGPKGSTSRRAVEESESEQDGASDSDSVVVEVSGSKHEITRKKPVLSEYERVRQFNIERNKKLLEEVMQDDGTNFMKDMQSAHPAKKKSTVTSCFCICLVQIGSSYDFRP